MKKRRNIVAAGLALAFAAAAVPGAAVAQQQAAFPNAPLKVIVPFAAGGLSDVVARVLGEKVGAELGQPVVVENRVGAGGAIGTKAVIAAKPDGLTLLSMSAANAILPLLQENVYDWERELVPVIGIGSVPYAIAVNAKSNIRSLNDLVAAAKATQGGINYASGGQGSPSHLAPARLVSELRVNATHVPYSGLAGAVQALLGNQVQFICATTADVTKLVKSGDLRLLAVTSEQRLPELADTPTMAELGFADFYPSTWYAFLVPARTPAAVVERLHGAFAKSASDPGVQERLRGLGLTITLRSGPELGRFMREDVARWRRVIQDNNIKLAN
ncbi:MAG TPA: tripartite tricarboxylate transporter substrate binding protein [Ramlibacter sp.]|nr:tripartite tricarboxylate transporter substrate binding protein [Ramlibacter sp.]